MIEITHTFFFSVIFAAQNSLQDVGLQKSKHSNTIDLLNNADLLRHRMDRHLQTRLTSIKSYFKYEYSASKDRTGCFNIVRT